MKVACITGASAGIGAIVAKGLAADGYHVALIARRIAALKSVADEIESLGGKAPLILPLDVSCENEVNKAVDRIRLELGHIDVLFNNAAINRRGTLDISYSDFDEQMRVNVRGAFNMLKAIVPVMKERGQGYIINTGSVASKIGFPDSGAYCASKFALLGLSESVYREFISTGLKITSICPSWVATEMSSYASFPPSQMIQAEDILGTVRYLLSLSPFACPKEIVIECSRDYGKR